MTDSSTKPRIDFFNQGFLPKTRVAILADMAVILESGRLMNGPMVQRLETHAAGLINRADAVTVNSCTTALTICLKYFGVQGKKVLVPSASFITCVSSIMFAGGEPVLVDINPKTLSFDMAALEKAITPDTVGIVWPHMTGFISPDFLKIRDCCKKHGLFLLEDCAQATGAKMGDLSAGALGDASCFSFYATKIVAAGNGGMILSDNADLCSYARKMRLFGKDSVSGNIIDLGNDWFLDEFRAAVVYWHFQELEYSLAWRKAMASQYIKHLANTSYIEFFDYGEGEPSFYQYAVLLAPAVDREKLIAIMKDEYGVDVRMIYNPIHHEKIFLSLNNGHLQNSEETLVRALCFPLHAALSDADIAYVCQNLLMTIPRCLK